MKLTAIDKTNLVEKVERQLLDLIQKNRLSVGDNLPTEQELTEGLGVSRSVVREAISRLRMLGLLETRKKGGMVIAEPNVFSGCKQIIDSSLLNTHTQRDLSEMRLTLEMGLADLLFLRRTDHDLQTLEAIVERELRANMEQERLKLEVEFHTTLYQIGRNELLLQFQRLLQPFFQNAVKQEERKIKGKSTHKDLLEELRSGTVEGFRKKMREHLQPHFDRLGNNPRRKE